MISYEREMVRPWSSMECEGCSSVAQVDDVVASASSTLDQVGLGVSGTGVAPLGYVGLTLR